MSGLRYRPIGYNEFQEWMAVIGFEEIDVPGTQEHVWERIVNCKRTADRPNRFRVRILSSVSTYTALTREVGADAIRVLLFDTQPSSDRRERIVKDWSVHRTSGARQNVVERARDAWGYVSQHPEHHCSCGSLMVERRGKKGTFLGCTSYPECKETCPLPPT